MIAKSRWILFGALVCAAIGACGWHIYQQGQLHREAVQEIEKLGGAVRDGSYGLAVDLCLFEITDRDLQVLAKLSHVNQLDLRYSQVTDEGLANVAKLGSLRNLNLSHTSITGNGLHHLQHLGLVGLHLQSTHLNDSASKHIARISSLKRLNLGSNRLTDTGVVDLAKLTRLDAINLSGTDVTAYRHIYDCDGATPRQRELLSKWRARYRKLGLLGRLRRAKIKRQRRRRMPVRRVPAWVCRMKNTDLDSPATQS